MATFTPARNPIGIQQVCTRSRKALVLCTLPLSIAAWVPLEATAATLSSTTSPAVLVLFTGFTQDPSSLEVGLNQLNTSLQNQFGNNPNQPFNSSIFEHSQSEEALNYINGFDTIGALGIIGYSLGGNTANQFAKDLPQTQLVNLLVQIDSVGSSDGELSGNVKQAFNYYQSNPSCSDCSFIERIQEFSVTQLVEQEVEGANNINLEAFFNDSKITHTTISNDVRLHQLIANNVSEFLLGSLPPVSETTLNFEPTVTPAAVNWSYNTFPLASNFYSTRTVDGGAESKSVPEPSIALSLLALGALSTAVLFRDKQ
mgnify:CR=1 FL=1